jgi:hypothetical protein
VAWPAADFTDATLALRAGVVLPTGPDQDSGFDEAFLPLIHLASRRPSDLAASAVDSTVVRLAASPAVQRGVLFARADVGLDVFIDSPGDDNPDPLYHIDLAAYGFKQGAAARPSSCRRWDRWAATRATRAPSTRSRSAASTTSGRPPSAAA